MVVNVSPRETRAALLENGILQELFVERASRRGLAGNLYKGRVSRVLPGMQRRSSTSGSSAPRSCTCPTSSSRPTPKAPSTRRARTVSASWWARAPTSWCRC